MRLLSQPRHGVWTIQAVSSQAPKVVTLNATFRDKDRIRTAVAYLCEPPTLQGQPGVGGVLPTAMWDVGGDKDTRCPGLLWAF